jgi:hypothetical protein
VVVPGCPTTETSNEDSIFAIPFQGPSLAPGYAKFYVFYRNETSGMVATMSILNPDNTVFNNWTRTSSSSYNNSYFGFSKLLPTQSGVYTFKAEYNGQICVKNFTITAAVGINLPHPDAVFDIYPNPGSEKFVIDLKRKISGENPIIEITNMLGEKVYSKCLNEESSILNFDAKSGIYFCRLVGSMPSQKALKLIVQ